MPSLAHGQLERPDPILTASEGRRPTGSAAGYLSEDVNMDGQARYTGVENDRDIILQNIGGWYHGHAHGATAFEWNAR